MASERKRRRGFGLGGDIGTQSDGCRVASWVLLANNITIVKSAAQNFDRKHSHVLCPVAGPLNEHFCSKSTGNMVVRAKISNGAPRIPLSPSYLRFSICGPPKLLSVSPTWICPFSSHARLACGRHFWWTFLLDLYVQSWRRLDPLRGRMQNTRAFISDGRLGMKNSGWQG